MFYKIINTECEIYKRIHEMRSKELQIEKDNITKIEEKTGLKWTGFLGHSGQQNFNRVTEYLGFKFKETEKVNPKIWKLHKDHEDVYVTNNRTKLGKEMSAFLSNGLEGNMFSNMSDVIGLHNLTNGRFQFPYVSIRGKVILIYIGDKDEPADGNIIEITKKEFNNLNK